MEKLRVGLSSFNASTCALFKFCLLAFIVWSSPDYRKSTISMYSLIAFIGGMHGLCNSQFSKLSSRIPQEICLTMYIQLSDTNNKQLLEETKPAIQRQNVLRSDYVK